MSSGLVFALVAVLAAYAAAVVALVLLGRGADARALARFVPDCALLFKRLLGDPRVSRRSKGMIACTVAYLALPIDLVPDFVPVAGQLDDAIVVALVLRRVLRATDAAVLRELWPGPPAVLARLAASQ